MSKLSTEYEKDSLAPKLNSGVDIFVYILALFDAKYFIIGLSLLCGLAAFAYSYTKPELYEAFVRNDLVNVEDPGGVSPDNRRASEVLTLVEHGFVLGTSKDNYLDVMLAKLRSRKFSLMFMEKYNVFKALYPEQWNDSEEVWTAGFSPDRGASFLLFNEQIRFIDHNPENDIISIRMRWSDPQLTRDWANLYVYEFNQYMRALALEDVTKKRAFLETELTRTNVVDIQQSIFRLIEAQTAVAMLVNAREEYVLEVIDPALLPFHRYSPSRKTFLILGLFVGGMLSVFFVLARMIFGELLASIKKYQVYQSQIPSHPQT